MNFSLIRTLGYYIGGVWTAWGGRKRIEAKQLKNLRLLIQKARKKSPYFNKLYAHLPDTNLIKLNDLPVTSKVDLMGEFGNWLTDRSLTLERAREHMESMDNLGVPVGEYAVFRTSGSSGEPAVVVIPSSVIEFIFGLSLARLSKKQLQIVKKIQKAGTNIIIMGGKWPFYWHWILISLCNILTPRLAKKITFIPAEQPIEKTVKTAQWDWTNSINIDLSKHASNFDK